MASSRAKVRLEVEALEDRTLLSGGNVSAFIKPSGDLIVHGDKGDNVFAIQQDVDGVLIRGYGGTTINGQSSGYGPVRISGDFTGNLKSKLSGGNDRLYLYEIVVPGDLVFDGGAGIDYLGLDEAEIHGSQSLKSVEGVGTGGQSVQQLKLNQAIEMLTRPKQAEEVYLQAINEGMEAIYTSNLVVLPTFNEPQTETNFHDNFLPRTEELIKALTDHVDGITGTGKFSDKLGTGHSKAMAAEARNFIQVTNDAMGVIGNQTSQCDPETMTGPACQILQQDDEAGTVVDQVLADTIFQRQVRSPFFLLPSLFGTPDEQVFLPGPVGPDECGIVVKEIQGLKVVVSAREIPIWVGPWYAGQVPIAAGKIWVWEFVPAEFIKTISFCNVDNGSGGREIDVEVQTQIILERQLLHFWRFINKEVTGVP